MLVADGVSAELNRKVRVPQKTTQGLRFISQKQRGGGWSETVGRSGPGRKTHGLDEWGKSRRVAVPTVFLRVQQFPKGWK